MSLRNEHQPRVCELHKQSSAQWVLSPRPTICLLSLLEAIDNSMLKKKKIRKLEKIYSYHASIYYAQRNTKR